MNSDTPENEVIIYSAGAGPHGSSTKATLRPEGVAEVERESRAAVQALLDVQDDAESGSSEGEVDIEYGRFRSLLEEAGIDRGERIKIGLGTGFDSGEKVIYRGPEDGYAEAETVEEYLLPHGGLPSSGLTPEQRENAESKGYSLPDEEIEELMREIDKVTDSV